MMAVSSYQQGFYFGTSGPRLGFGGSVEHLTLLGEPYITTTRTSRETQLKQEQ